MTGESRPDRDRTRFLFERMGTLDPTSAERRDVRDEIVEAYLPLVRYIARRFANRGESVDDLEQIGTVGLLQAVDRFEVERGLEFSTFATPSIAGEIKRHFRDRGWMVRVPRRLQELQSDLTRGTADLTHKLGRSPTVAELAEHLDVSEEDIIEAGESAHAYSALSIDTPNAATGVTIADTLTFSDAELDHVEIRQSLRPALQGLNPRERKAILLRFVENKTQSEIAEVLGISQVHVSRLLAKTLVALRERLPDVDIAG